MALPIALKTSVAGRTGSLPPLTARGKGGISSMTPANLVRFSELFGAKVHASWVKDAAQFHMVPHKNTGNLSLSPGQLFFKGTGPKRVTVTRVETASGLPPPDSSAESRFTGRVFNIAAPNGKGVWELKADVEELKGDAGNGYHAKRTEVPAYAIPARGDILIAQPGLDGRWVRTVEDNGGEPVLRAYELNKGKLKPVTSQRLAELLEGQRVEEAQVFSRRYTASRTLPQTEAFESDFGSSKDMLVAQAVAYAKAYVGRPAAPPPPAAAPPKAPAASKPASGMAAGNNGFLRYWDPNGGPVQGGEGR